VTMVSQFGNHQFPAGHFEQFAEGGGEPEAISLLLSAEWSRRLLLVRELLSQAERQPQILGSLPPVEDVWRALARLDADPRVSATLRSVLMHPQVGTWVARTLRLIASETDDGTPLWVEAGQIHAAIFAAAVRAGVNFSSRLPVRRGYVLLPTLGLARVPARDDWAIAEAETRDGLAWLSVDGVRHELPAPAAAESAGWWPLRRVRADAGGLAFEAWIDDIDFYRDLAEPVAPQRLEPVAFERWNDLVDDAWKTLTVATPDSAAAIAAGISSLVPLPSDGTSETRSASTGDAFGAAMISLPPDPLTLAVSLVHEFQHIKLGGVIHLTALYHSGNESEELVYAPWRDDPRPLPGLLQGVYAFLGIAEFWRRHRKCCAPADASLSEFEFAYSRRQAWVGLRTIAQSSWLTDLGRRFAAGMGRTLRLQLAESISPDAARAAWGAAAEHRSAWQLRHLRCDPERVEGLADAFLRDSAADVSSPVPRALVPGAGNYWHRSRLALHRMKLIRPDRFSELAAGNTPVLGATTDDLALVSGHTASATAGYLAAVAAEPVTVDPWTGLGLALTADGRRPGWRSLVRRPELVRALYLAIRRRDRDVSALAVASWLDRLAPAVR
jgi:HEXXH motif-containing protein